MITKYIINLEPGDVLKRKSNNEFCIIKQIIKKDSEDDQMNFEFDGFLVKEKVMRKFFWNDGSKILIYNEKI